MKCWFKFVRFIALKKYVSLHKQLKINPRINARNVICFQTSPTFISSDQFFNLTQEAFTAVYHISLHVLNHFF